MGSMLNTLSVTTGTVSQQHYFSVQLQNCAFDVIFNLRVT